MQINSKTFDLLLALIENNGRIIEKDELLELVWPNQIVEEGNLTVKMSALRRALGEKKDDARFIVTIPGKGYRFVADVKPIELNGGGLVIERHAVTHILVEEEKEIEDEPSHIIESRPVEQISNGNRLAMDIHVQPLPQSSALASASERKSKTSLKYGLVAFVITLFGLSALGYWLYQKRDSKNTVVSISFQQASVRRLTASGKISGAAISPDGKYLVYAQKEGEGESLWVRQVAESRSIKIRQPEAIEYWGLTFSPDSTHIYCTIFTSKKADPELLRIPTFGGPVERLPNVSCSSVTFSPDGKRFAYFVSSSDAGGTLLRIANADGREDKVLTILKHPSYFVYPDKTISWSPDGETIACAAKIVDESGDYGTVLGVRVSDGKHFQIASHRWPWVESVSWLPDMSGLLVTANQNAASPMQIWYLAYPRGEAHKLSNDLNWYSWSSMTADGRTLLAVQRATSSSLWVADYENEIGPVKQIANEVGTYGEIAWTPEGNIVYRSSASGPQNLWTISADGSNQTQLTKDAMPDKGLSVSPDGRYIVFSSYRAGKYNLWRVSSDGGNLTQLTNGAGEIFPRITPDSQWVIFQQGVGATVSNIWKTPIEGGPAKQITKEHSSFISLSPDGKLISYFYMDRSKSKEGQWRIGVVKVEDGLLEFSFDMPENIIGRVARWTPDSQAIVYAKSNGEVGNLWLQKLDKSGPVRISDFDKETIADFAWSRDGKHFAFTRSARISDVVLIQNFK